MDDKHWMHYALARKAVFAELDKVRLLLKLGADPGFDDSRALRWACRVGNTDVVRLLLKAGADPLAGSPTALEEAEACGWYDTIKVLRKVVKNTL